MRSVEDLDVFKLAHRLALEIYKLTATFPREELYGLTAQMRDAAASAPSNLVEGAHRNSPAEYRNFVGIARGSAGEVRYHLLLARDLGYAAPSETERLRGEYTRVIQMLTSLARAVSGRKSKEPCS